ncbi:MAG: trypsin-like peptidase domain-containing protein [Gammaproteobacteria bacterium]|jgi:S1-C subfamily serine protease|nr:trypsin-like peptidase domain-containing protein [Gammaproteobacteria bacterium]
MKKTINYIFWPALAGLIFALTVMFLSRFSELYSGMTNANAESDQQESLSIPLSFNSAIEKVMPAVVTINLQQVLADSDGSSNLDNSISGIINRQYGSFDENNSLGSGVIISEDGYVITSYHIFFSPETGVLNFPETITATLDDGRTVNARPLLYDEASDLALLKIDTPNISYIEPSTTSNMQVGDFVVAIGNPRNIGLSASLGIVSAIHRSDDSYLIQTDAAINPGYSGGALIDAQGNLIGINSNILSESGGSEGLGFATHSSMISLLLNYYYQSGPGGYLGVNGSELFTRNEGLLLYGQLVEGAKVSSLVEDGPAEQAGIEVGDIITGFNQKKFGALITEDDLFEAIAGISNLGAGEVVEIEVYRKRNFLRIPVTLGVGEPFILFSVQ